MKYSKRVEEIQRDKKKERMTFLSDFDVYLYPSLVNYYYPIYV